MYFEYGDKETEYLKRRDKRLGEAIDAIGHIERELDATATRAQAAVMLTRLLGQEQNREEHGFSYIGSVNLPTAASGVEWKDFKPE
jgi:hypothetical protein